MPTGYTAQIEKGISFEDFVLSCARAFGALIMMRDEPADASIPEQFEPSDYHRKKVEEIEIEIARLKEISVIDALVKAQSKYEESIKCKEDGIRKATELQAKYLIMLGKAKAWQAPSPDHIGLKDFMIQQIENSIKFDCSTKYYEEQKLKQLSGKEWISKQFEKLLKDLAYHKKEDAEEIERTTGRNLWIKQLRESLK